jgi:hypothetical protein
MIEKYPVWPGQFSKKNKGAFANLGRYPIFAVLFCAKNAQNPEKQALKG